MFDTIQRDMKSVFEHDPAARTTLEVILCYPGFHAVLLHRVAHRLWGLRLRLLGRWVSHLGRFLTGIEIHPGARIGRGFFVDHGMGVVIGETAEIGENVTLYQGVTLGAKSFPLDKNGNPIKGIKRHPDVEDDVVIYSEATILGSVVIGRGSIIGGNVWLVRSVPPGSRVTQAQVRQDAFEGGAGI